MLSQSESLRQSPAISTEAHSRQTSLINNHVTETTESVWKQKCRVECLWSLKSGSLHRFGPIFLFNVSKIQQLNEGDRLNHIKYINK